MVAAFAVAPSTELWRRFGIARPHDLDAILL
jgi:hypothetical protein